MKLVKGEGPKKAKLMLIGEAPGREEAKKGRPFIGRAGKFLDELLKKNRISRKKVYITNVVKKYTGRKPTKAELWRWAPELSREIQKVKPRIIVLLETAMHPFLPGKKLSKVHGRRFKINRVILIPTFHPAAGMRFPKIRKMMEEDFKKI